MWNRSIRDRLFKLSWQKILEDPKNSWFLSPLIILAELYKYLLKLWRGFYKNYFYWKWEGKGAEPAVISVGNIVAGGTGKTPFTIRLAQMFADRGLKIAIILRGYGRQIQDPKKIIRLSPEEALKERAVIEAGDEAVLLARQLPFVTVFSCPKRKRVIEKHGAEFDLFLMDDGFQHLKVKRHFDFVLLNSSRPFSNGYCFPRGLLRESIDSLKYADALVLTHFHANNRTLRNNFNLPMIKTSHQASRLRLIGAMEDKAPGFLKDKRILAFCGIAHPDSFKKLLEEYEPGFIYFESFADHHHYVEKDWENLQNLKKRKRIDLMVTTAKDEVKIPAKWLKKIGNIYSLDIEVVISPEDEIILNNLMEPYLISKLG